MHEQLVKYLEENKILAGNEFGYRKKYSNELATLFLVDEISKQIRNENMVGTLSIYLSKAFHTLSCSICENEILWYEKFSSEMVRVQTCEIDGQRSSPSPITCGVPQVSILGPILVFLYANIFENCLNSQNFWNFAVDIIVFLPGRTNFEID